MTAAATTGLSSPPSTAHLAAVLWRRFLGRYWKRLLLALGAMGVYSLSASMIPIGVEWINSAFAGGSGRFSANARDVLVAGPLLVVALGAANAAAQYAQSRLSLGAALRALRDMQNAMFGALMRLDVAQQKAESSGQFVGRFTNDVQVLRETLTRASSAVRDALTLIGLCVVMVYYDWALFLIVVFVYALVGWPVARIGKYLRKTSREAQVQAGELVSLVGETLDAARVVKTYNLQPSESARASDAFERRLRLQKRLAYTRALNEPFLFFVGSLAFAVVVAAVAWRVMQGALDGAQFVAFIVALLLLSQPLRGLGSLHAVMQEGFGAFERILALCDAAPCVVDRPGAKALTISGGALSFRDVRFSYRPGQNALDGFSLDLPPGKTTALVGESGAGKSTVLQLVARLYDLDSGAILIDGQDIAGATLQSLRAQVAVVDQDAVLFDDTIRANIARGNPKANFEKIAAAAEAAAIDDFIRSLPGGYDARVGEGGASLSGGQRQRIALARAFLKDAPILLLDEATSALDAESEAKIQRAMERLFRGRTTLVVAHRLSTVRAADMIAVVDRGRVVEMGAHDDLIARSGAYARLAALELREAAPA